MGQFGSDFERELKDKRNKEWEFETDPFKVRNSRPEPDRNILGFPTMYYNRSEKKSLHHRLMDRNGWLSKDPYTRQIQKIKFERRLLLGACVMTGATMWFASQPDFEPEPQQTL